MNRLQFVRFIKTPHRLFLVFTIALFYLNTLVCNAAIQQNQVVQVKVFTESLSPYPNLTLSINKNEYVTLNEKGIVYVNLANSDIPIQSIKLKDESIEVASWNLSKGILEVIIRKKSYVEKEIKIIDEKGVGVPQVEVIYTGNKKISKQTNKQGIIRIPLGLDEEIQSIEQFKISGYQLLSLNTQSGVMIKVRKDQPNEPNVEGQNTKVQVSQHEIIDANGLLLQKLDTIASLRAFYNLLSRLEQEEISDTDQLKLDRKFEELLLNYQSTINPDTANLLTEISDSTGVEKDIDKIFEQVKKDNASMSKQRRVLEEKIEVVINKLNTGFENMSEDTKNNLLNDIEELEKLLETNKSEFTDNLNSYLTVITELKRRFFDLQELEKKLSESERERLEEKRIYQKRLILSVAIAMVFALLIVLLFYLRSKLKKQQRELIEANKAVKLTNENLENIVMERTYLLNKTFNELDTVLYKASHDLRAPLSSMAGIIDLISRETNNTELTGLLVKTNERMDKMLKKLSTISEIHQPGDFEKVHIKKICEDVFSNFRSLVEERKIDFETNINVGRNVVSIAKLLEVIIYHLLDNALFFCWINNDNSRKVNLEIQTSEEKLTIKISNNGITVDENIKDKIFEMFYVGSELSTGNGLGLYIVQKSVDLLDGKVELSVDQANHTVFTVQIPLNGKGSSTLAFLGNIKTK